MSFLKITDPKKRDAIVAEYLQVKKNIKNAQLAERLGEQDSFANLTKQFKPITDVQKDLNKSIINELAPIKNNFQDYQQAVKFSQQIPAIETDERDESGMRIGSTAANYLKKFTTKEADTTYGIHSKNGEFYIGDTKIEVTDNNIAVGEKEYEGTPGLWELIVMKTPNAYTDDDYEKYAEIMVKTNTLKRGNIAEENHPKSNRGEKWKQLLKPIWEDSKKFEGEGLKTIIIPSDPNALLERLDLLLASKNAGNTGVRNEIISICDELKRQKVISKNQYKQFMLLI